jgi:hypothetical protein
MRYDKLDNIDDVRICLHDIRDAKVEAEKGFPLSVDTVADLRALTYWSRGWLLDLDVRREADPRFSLVKVERT